MVRAVRGALICAGALLFAVTFTPIVPWAAGRLACNWSDGAGGVLIVLVGSSVDQPGSPPGTGIGADTYWRALYAADAWRRGHFEKILLCGAGCDRTVKPLLLFEHVPESAIVTEDRSHSTHENALLAKPLLAGLPGRRVLLTSDYHMWRASRCFAREGIPVTTRPVPDVLKISTSLQYRWVGFLTVAGELCKIAWYRAHGWI